MSLPNLATLDLIFLIGILLALCFWLVLRIAEIRLKKTLQKQSDESLFEPPFKCVLFNAGAGACTSAIAYQTKPILLSNAPELPLRGCDSKKCECSLFQHEDRRTGTDRRDKELLNNERKSIYADKRRLKDRRRDSIRQFLLPQYRTFG